MTDLISPVIFGEVLFDCFPDGTRVLGGAPFNVAWNCHAFGLNPIFISRVGNDELGREIFLAMQDWGMDTKGLQIDSQYKTGMVDVSFEDGEPAYNIVENSAWDFIDFNAIPDIQNHNMLYHGSLALRHTVSENSLLELKKKYSDSTFVDVNLRSPWWSLPKIRNILSTARWLKLNQHELSLLVPEETDVVKQARYLVSQFSPTLVIVTQGEEGAIAVTAEDKYTIIPEGVAEVIDTVGAGDAFSSVLLLGLHKDWPLPLMLSRAQDFASSVVTLRGATTHEKEFYQPFIKDWRL